MAKNTPQPPQDLSAEIRPLIHKLGLSVTDEGHGAIVTFIAARAGEGTTTVARSFAKAFSAETGKKVLLIDGSGDENAPGKGLVELAASGADISAGLSETDPGVFTGKWIASAHEKVMAGRVVQDKSFWQTLQRNFDAVIIDAPALQTSPDGISFAQVSTVTVLVVEAETTRQEVVENTRDTLAAANAKIAGIVMNKRKLYIPEKVYKRL